MLTLLSGNDESAKSAFVLSMKKKYANGSMIELGKEATKADILDAILSEGLFCSQKLVVVKPKSWEVIDIPETEVEVIVDISALKKNTLIHKKIAGFATKKVFDLPPDYSNFKIADALFIYNNKKGALQMLAEKKDLDTEFYFVLSTLQASLRNFLCAKYRNKTFEKLHPFVKKKALQMKSLDQEKAKELYKKLFDLDTELKFSKSSRMAVFQDFVLYSL